MMFTSPSSHSCLDALRLGLRRRRGRGGLRLFLLLALVALLDDGRAAAQALEVREPDAHAEADGLPRLEVQLVVGVGVGREPVLAVYLLAVGLERGEALVELGHALAARLDDLQVLIVNPDAPLKEALGELRLLERGQTLLVAENL